LTSKLSFSTKTKHFYDFFQKKFLSKPFAPIFVVMKFDENTKYKYSTIASSQPVGVSEGIF
jgi:hypothetical protein